jgi:xanthine dehydrogenase accessory factor
LNSAILEGLVAARSERRSAVLVTSLEDGQQRLFEGSPAEPTSHGELAAGPELEDAAAAAMQEGRSRTLELAGARCFVHVFLPPLRLAVVGAVHIAQPLVSMAAQAGYAVILIDPRGAWATEERFPDVDIDRRWPTEALGELAPDERTAIVTLTHDPKLDDPALLSALSSSAFYIGSLGSRRTQARRLERLRELGVAESELPRIHGPVGLDIAAVSPAEIAISILAEITQVLGELRGARR